MSDRLTNSGSRQMRYRIAYTGAAQVPIASSAIIKLVHGKCATTLPNWRDTNKERFFSDYKLVHGKCATTLPNWRDTNKDRFFSDYKLVHGKCASTLPETAKNSITNYS